MIAEEVSEGIASTRVAIAGFSQVGITESAAVVPFCTVSCRLSHACFCLSCRSLAGLIFVSIYLLLATCYQRVPVTTSP